MASKKQMRSLWLQVHKWIGLTLALLIIPISLTGSALVWKSAIDAKLQPQRYARLGAVALPPSEYARAARSTLQPGERLSELHFARDDTPVIALAIGSPSGPPGRISIWIDPRNGSVIDRASGNSGILQTVHSIHGNLMVPGWGRTIVGWVGAFMFVSCLTGIWLWWPLSGSVVSGLQWKRRNTANANLHYMAGFWVLFPLAMLSFTGAWISFPKLFGTFDSRATVSDRERAIRAQPEDRTATSVDAAVASAKSAADGRLSGIVWPTDRNPGWKISLDSRGGSATVTVDDASGKSSVAPQPPETLARTMRRLHDGTGMGPVWQTAIFLAGLIPALLSITGIIIWWRARKPRSRARVHRRTVQQSA